MCKDSLFDACEVEPEVSDRCHPDPEFAAEVFCEIEPILEAWPDLDGELKD